MPQNILLVEDDRNFGDVLKSYLEMHNYNVILATDGEEGWQKYKSGKFDLHILDVMMPKKDGFTLGKEIKEDNSSAALIFLTAKALKEDVIDGFKIGADDYITKPFNSEELLYRVQAVLKRSGSTPNPAEKKKEFQIGAYHFNYPLRILTYKSGEEVHKDKLSPKEAHLLRFCLLYTSPSPRD